MPGLVSTGFKRKHDALEEDEGKGCSQPQANTMQRQSVLNISICKLKTTRALIEPSLRRSVLICNTLRQIEQELRAEGHFFDSTQLSRIIANQSVEENTDDKEISSATDSSNSVAQLLMCQRTQEVCIPKDCVRKAENGALQQIDPLSRTMCGCIGCHGSNPRVSSTTISIMSNHLTSKVHSLGSKEPNLRLPSNTTSDNLDELYSDIDIDIDINMYDIDIGSQVMLNPKPTIHSNAEEDWLKSLMGDLTTTLGTTTDSSQQTNLAEELDQIMHVLVDAGM